jgi:hypothetical protein
MAARKPKAAITANTSSFSVRPMGEPPACLSHHDVSANHAGLQNENVAALRKFSKPLIYKVII